MNQVLLNFNGGEINPYLAHRTDFAKHPSAAARMENFIPLPFGPLVKRPGTRFVSTLPVTVGTNSRAFAFTASDSNRYIVLITPGNIRIISAAGILKSTLTFLDANADVTRTHYIQINDVAYITHPDCHPRLLTTTSDTTWALSFIPFVKPPTLDRNLDKDRFISLLSNPIADLWVSATTYALSDVVLVDGSEWECTLGHTSGPTTRPVTGALYATYWRRKLYSAGDPVTLLSYGITAPDWRNEPDFYPAGTIRRFDPALVDGLDIVDFGEAVPQYQRAKIDHTFMATGAADNITATWGTYWEYIWEINRYEVLTTAEVDMLLRIGDRLFRCIEEHTPDPAVTTPVTGSAWETYWIELDAPDLVDLSANLAWTYPRYLLNNRASVNGIVYNCILAHFVTAGNKPGTAGGAFFWETVADPNSLFDPLHAASAGISPGSYWEISPSREDTDFQIERAALDGLSQNIAVQGPWAFNTFGEWFGTWTIQRSDNQGETWETIRSHQSNGDRNISDAGIEDTAVLLRLRYQQGDGTNVNARAVLTPERSFIQGHALADVYVNSNLMEGTALAPMLSGRTSRWAEGAFSRLRGHPQAIAFHDNRLVLAGTSHQPTSLWFSAVDGYQDFLIGSDPADAIAVTLATGAENRIRWMASQRRLFVGTRVQEWIVGAGDNESPITPTDVSARTYTSHGSGFLQPATIADSFIFISRNRQRIREIAYSDDRASYIAPELTRLADHLTSSGIRSIAWQQSREPALWVTTQDGKLLHFAYAREDQITAWSRHTTQDGAFRHVVVFPGDDGDDLVLLITTRTYGATSASLLEYLQANWFSRIEAGANDAFDAAILAATDAAITTPPIFNGQPLTALLEDFFYLPLTPSDGQVTPPTGSQNIRLGLPVTATLETLPIDLSDGTSGTHSTRRRIHEVSLNLSMSAGGSITHDGITESLELLEPFTGWHDKTLPPAHSDTLTFTISHSTHHPFTLLAMALRWRPSEKSY